MNEEEIKRVLEKFAEKFPELNKEMDKFGDALKDLTATLLKLETRVDLVVKKLGEMCGKIVETTKALDKFKKSLDGSGKAIDEHSTTVSKATKSVSNESKGLNKALNEAAEGEKQLLRTKKEMLSDEDKARKEASSRLRDDFAFFGGAVIGTAGKAITQASISAMQSSDAFRMATGVMNSQLDLINISAQAGAKGIQNAGNAMAAAGGKAAVVGTGISMLGAAAGFASDQLTQLAKAGISMMLRETEKTLENFKAMSSAGAIYVGGMHAMQSTAVSAGLTLDQLTKAVSANKEEFAKSGLGVADGSKRMAAAMKEGGARARDGMFALGMGMEDQADAYAATMALMSGPSGQLRASNSEVAAQTQEYAANLKLISDITGKDAKAKMEKLRQDNDTLAFNSYLNGLSEEERKRTVEAMNAMSDLDQKAFREKQIYGTYISKDVNIARATNSGIAKAQDEQIRLARDHNLRVATVGETYSKNADEMLAEANRSGRSLGLSQNADAQAGAAASNASTQYAIKWREVQKKRLEIEEQQGKGKAGVDEASQLLAVQQDVKLEMAALAYDLMPKFAEGLKATVAATKDMVIAMAKVGINTGTTLGTPFSPEAIMTFVGGFAVQALATLMTGSILKKNQKAENAALAKTIAESVGGGGGGSGSSSSPGRGRGSRSGGRRSGGTQVLTDLAGAPQMGAIEGVLTGLANGLKAFGNPLILKGAAILSGSIVIIGAGIAGASWLMGKALPTLAEGLKAFNDINGLNLLTVGGGMVAVGAGLAAMGAGSAVGAVGNLLGAGLDKLGDLLGVDGPFKKLEAFSKLQIDAPKVKANAEAMVAFTTAMASSGGAGVLAGLGMVAESIGTFIGRFFAVDPPVEKLRKFGEKLIDPNGNVVKNAEAMHKFADAMKAMKDVPTGPGVFSAIGEGIGSLFSNSHAKKLKEFGELDINPGKVEQNAKAFKAYADAMFSWKGYGAGSSTSRQSGPSQSLSASQSATPKGNGASQSPLPGGTSGLLEQIARGEGTSDETAKSKGFDSGFDVTLAYGKYGKSEKPLSQMTIAEVKQLQSTMLRNGAPSTAVGKYQMLSNTLSELQVKLGIPDDQKFDGPTQTRLAEALLERRGLSKFASGEISQDQFQQNLSMEWASVATAKDDTYKGKSVKAGESFYGQHVGTTDAQIKTAISKLGISDTSTPTQAAAIDKAGKTLRLSPEQLALKEQSKANSDEEAAMMGNLTKGLPQSPKTHPSGWSNMGAPSVITNAAIKNPMDATKQVVADAEKRKQEQIAKDKAQVEAAKATTNAATEAAEGKKQTKPNETITTPVADMPTMLAKMITIQEQHLNVARDLLAETSSHTRHIKDTAASVRS